ncbi:DUF3891 family protein [Paenibacillus dendritiformis]|uniref:DUF3891 family protein n=1 Tax=Paenibacillus dendritiformis TaxID=130049 RepID=UPI00387E1526
MIMRTRNEERVLIRQHDHGFISGEAAKHFDPARVGGTERWEEAVLAAYEHDRSWIGLDHTPIWNDADAEPFTFMDYPIVPKLAFYRIGLDEIEQMNAYAALLCSLHFVSFFRTEEQPEIIQFLRHERARQARIREQLGGLDDQAVTEHFRLLQFCDDLSLYVCLNEPGTAKEDEFPWYQDGFERTEAFNPETGTQLVAEWVSETEVRVRPFPFLAPFTTKLRSKVVPNSLVEAIGIGKAYRQTEWTEQTLTFVR